MNMTPAERVAQRTWYNLGHAEQLRARFGEETLTDLLVVDMLPSQRARGFWLAATTKRQEHRWGADLLVVVRHPTGRWSSLALQAKKLYPDDRYRMLNRVTESLNQLTKLERFARQHRALPLYLLYNHTTTVEHSEHWHCGQPFAECQLGCTLVPSWHVLRMLRRRPPPRRGFDSAHKIKQARPWRCAFDCPCAEKELDQMAFRTPDPSPDTLPADPPYDWDFGPMEEAWPEWLFRKSTPQLTRNDLDRLRSRLYEGRPDERLYPARVLVVDRAEEGR